MTEFKEELMLHSSDLLSLIRTTAMRAAGLGLVFSIHAITVQADGFDVQPAQLALSAKNPAATFRISNPGTEDITVQLQVMDWSNENGRIKQSPSRGLIVHPDRVSLRPGASQIVRVGLRLSAPMWKEVNYRLVLSEVARTPDVGVTRSAAPDTQALTRTSLPVVVLPPGQAPPQMVTIAGSK